MKKRLLSLLLAIVMVLGLIPAMAPAANAASNMVAKVEAVGTGYAYDSEAGAFAPTFSSMTAYDSAGNAIDIEGFVWSTPFYTKESFGSANRLLYEPEDGVTYYFAIYVDQYVNKDLSYDYTSSKDLMEKSVVTLPGFKVECISFMEREMGSYLELTYAATRKYHVVEVGDTKLYDGDTYQGGKGGTLTVDGYNVTMNNFKDSSGVFFPNEYCEDYYEEDRPVFSDMMETLKLTIIGENSVGSITARRDLKIYGTMYDSLTIQGSLKLFYFESAPASGSDYIDWDCWIYGGNYKMNEIDFSGFYKTKQGLIIYDGASVEVSGEVNVYGLRVEHSKLAANSIYSSISQHNYTPLTFRNSRIELIDRMYHRRWTESDVWAEIYGGAFKGKTDYTEIYVQERESFDCLDFRAEMVGTGSAGGLSGDITVKAKVYNPAVTPFPYDYIDVECKDARSITCKNATASAETAVPGTAVTITADPAPEGKVFYRWEIVGIIKDIANPYSPTTTFTMDVGRCSGDRRIQGCRSGRSAHQPLHRCEGGGLLLRSRHVGGGEWHHHRCHRHHLQPRRQLPAGPCCHLPPPGRR